MKIIHGSLSALLSEVKAHGKTDGVRVAALMQSTVEGVGLPRYTSWVIVSAQVDWDRFTGATRRAGFCRRPCASTRTPSLRIVRWPRGSSPW